MTLSRRRFLQLTGIAAASSQVSGLFALPDLTTDVVYGRALAALPVYRKGRVVQVLWPDAVLPLRQALDGWYETDGGYVERSGVQPMPGYSTAIHALQTPPYIAEVVGAVAVVRAYASAGAPLVTRIGHGGVAQVVDVLPDEDGAWLGIADEFGALMGWSQAGMWRPADLAPFTPSERRIQVDTVRHELTIFENDAPLLTTPVALSLHDDLKAGRYAIAAASAAQSWNFYHGLAWPLRIDDVGTLAGVYWHNDFGARAAGPAVQVMPAVARWLASWVTSGSVISVI